MEGDDGDFHDGQVVWAKLDGYPWWPSRVAKLTEVKPEVLLSKKELNDVLIYFFGSHDYSFLRRNKVQSYEIKYDARVKDGILSKRRGFKAGLLEVEDWHRSGKIFPVYTATSQPKSNNNTTHSKKRTSLPPTSNLFDDISSLHSCTAQTTNSMPATAYELEWANEDVEEEVIDDIVLVCCAKNMYSLVMHHNEKKRKIIELMEKEITKRAKTSATPDPVPTPQTQHMPQNPPILPQRGTDSVLLQLQQHNSVQPRAQGERKVPLKPQSNLPSSTAPPVRSSALHPRKTSVYGEMTNPEGAPRGTAKFSGALEGHPNSGFFVEFSIEGRLYRGFLLPQLRPILPSHEQIPGPDASVDVNNFTTASHTRLSSPQQVNTSANVGAKINLNTPKMNTKAKLNAPNSVALAKLGLGTPKLHLDSLVELGVNTVCKALALSSPPPHVLNRISLPESTISKYQTTENSINASISSFPTPPSSPTSSSSYSSRRPGRPRRYILSSEGETPIPSSSSLNDNTSAVTTDAQQRVIAAENERLRLILRDIQQARHIQMQLHLQQQQQILSAQLQPQQQQPPPLAQHPTLTQMAPLIQPPIQPTPALQPSLLLVTQQSPVAQQSTLQQQAVQSPQQEQSTLPQQEQEQDKIVQQPILHPERIPPTRPPSPSQPQAEPQPFTAPSLPVQPHSAPQSPSLPPPPQVSSQ